MSDRHPSMTDRKTLRIRQLSSGLVFERSAPDARECVQTGGFEYVADAPSVVDVLAATPLSSLQAMARRAGIGARYNDTDHELRALLLPLVESGAVTFTPQELAA